MRHKTPGTILASTLVLALVGCKPPPSSEDEPVDEVTGKAETAAVREQPPEEKPAAEEGDIPAPDDVAEPPADATKTASGLCYKVLQQGHGDKHPGPTSQVMVHYTGWTTDGKMFDSSVKRGKESIFPLDKVIPGWGEAVQLMVQGEKTRFWIPEELAYKGKPDRPQGMLVFDVELRAILTD